jgi:transposase
LRKQGRQYPAQRKWGKAKNGRNDVPQIVIGLAITRDGLPVRSWVFPGNTADLTTAELASLQQTEGECHSKRACELRTSERFGRYLRTTAGGRLELDRSAVKAAGRYDGKWVVTSNDDTLSTEDLALGYKQLMRVEECWRQLQSGLRLRPVFHYRPWRIHAHVTLTVFALLLERIAEIRAGETWRNLRDQLNAIKVIEYEHAGARIRQTTELEPNMKALLKRLKVGLPPMIHVVQSAGQS